VPLFSGARPHLGLTQCRLGQRLPPYQVASGSIQPFGPNRAENWRAAVPLFRGKLGPHVTQCGLGRGLPHTNWYLDPCSRLATVRGPKLGVLCPLFAEERGPHLTQRRLRGLPVYQVAS